MVNPIAFKFMMTKNLFPIPKSEFDPKALKANLESFIGPNKTKSIAGSRLMKNNIYSTFASTFISDSIFRKIIPDFWSMDPSISKSYLFNSSLLKTAWINGAKFIECFVCHNSCLSLIIFSCKFKFFIKSFFSTTLHTLKMPLKPGCSEEILFISIFMCLRTN